MSVLLLFMRVFLFFRCGSFYSIFLIFVFRYFFFVSWYFMRKEKRDIEGFFWNLG